MLSMKADAKILLFSKKEEKRRGELFYVKKL